MPTTGKEKAYKRILLKLSGEELMGDEGFGIDPKSLIAWHWKLVNWSALVFR